jgi:hypothetical protein
MQQPTKEKNCLSLAQAFASKPKTGCKRIPPLNLISNLQFPDSSYQNAFGLKSLCA